MGIAEKLNEFQKTEHTYTFPDGEVLQLRPVRALEVIPRLGVPANSIGQFLAAQGGMGDVSAMQPDEIPDAVLLAGRLEEAYFVYGIVGPVKLRFTHEDDPGDGSVDATTFRQFVVREYGQEVLDDLTRRLHEVSGEIRPEEVAQNRAGFREVAQGAPLRGEDVRDEPDRIAPSSSG